MISNTTKGTIMVLLSIVIYSFNTNFMKLLMPLWIEPQGLTLLRCFGAGVGFWIYALFLPSTPKKQPRTKDIWMIMLGGALGLGINLLLYIDGLSRSGPVDAFVIRTVQPILVFLLSILILHTKFSLKKAIGIAFGLAGALYASILPHANEGVQDSFLGDAMIFISCLVNALFLIIIKPFTQKFNTFVVMKWMCVSATIINIPFGLKQCIDAPIFHTNAPFYAWFYLFYVVIFTTMVAYYLSVNALKYISATTESTYLYLMPITGSLVTISMGIQKFSWHDPIALILIIIGFSFINTKNKKETLEYDNSQSS